MDKKLNVTVLGGGNLAQTMAADISLAGFDVNLFDLPEFNERLKALKENGNKLHKIGLGRKGVAQLNNVTTNLDEAIGNTDIIFLAVPAFGHMPFYKALAEKLKDGQIVVTTPGNWGSLRLYNLMKEKGINTKVKMADTSLCLYICRAAEGWLGPQVVRILLERPDIQVAAMPAKDTPTVLAAVKQVYPQFNAGSNLLETGLNNANIIYHGPMVLMNTGWLEHTKGDIMFYRDGVTPSIGRTVDAIFNEKDAILNKLGMYAPSHISFYKRIKKAKWPHDPCEFGPADLKHRYVAEDIPCGLVLMAQIGDLLNIDTPISDAMINIASIANEIDYWKEGTTLKTLGLDNLNLQQIIRFLETGEK